MADGPSNNNSSTIAEHIFDRFAEYFRTPTPEELAAQQKRLQEAQQILEKQFKEKAAAEAEDNRRAQILFDKFNLESSIARGQDITGTTGSFPDTIIPPPPVEQFPHKDERYKDIYAAQYVEFAKLTPDELASKVNNELKKVDTQSIEGYARQGPTGQAFIDVFIATLQTGRLRINLDTRQVEVGTSHAFLANLDATTQIALAALVAHLNPSDAAAAIALGVAPGISAPGAPTPNVQGPNNVTNPAPGVTVTPQPPQTGGNFVDVGPPNYVIPPKPGTPAGGATVVGPGGKPVPNPAAQLKPPVDNAGNILPGPFGGGFPDNLFAANPADP